VKCFKNFISKGILESLFQNCVFEKTKFKIHCFKLWEVYFEICNSEINFYNVILIIWTSAQRNCEGAGSKSYI